MSLDADGIGNIQEAKRWLISVLSSETLMQLPQ